MKIHGWAYAKERTRISPFCDTKRFRTPSGKWLGAVYAVIFEVNQNFTLVKIGATSMPKQRLVNFGPRGKLYCVSPLCTNFFEIEEQLHNHFNQYRVPGRTNASQPEYFNMSIPFFLSHLPKLEFKME